MVTGAGSGPGFSPAVRAFRYDGQTVSAIAKVNFMAYAFGFGAAVAAGDADRDGYAEIATTTGPGPLNPS